MKNILKEKKEMIIQFIKFSIVGVSNTAVSLSIYYILITINVNYIAANTIGFIISVLNSYYWNSKYVFKSKEESKYRMLVKMYMSYSVTLLLGTTLLYIMVDCLHMSKYIVPLINIAITVPINFLLNKLWTFKDND